MTSLDLAECQFDLENYDQAGEYYKQAISDNRVQLAYIYFKMAQSQRKLNKDCYAFVNFKKSCKLIMDYQLKFTIDYIEFFEYSLNVIDAYKLGYDLKNEFLSFKMDCQKQLKL